jgi:GT2 family glycosyltransferase
MTPREPRSQASRPQTAPPPASPAAAAGRHVSVVIVNYRTYDELDACLASLPHAPGVEAIVIDHESTPGELERLRARHAGVAFVASDRNPGFAAGVNAGARLATGRYILVLNPDTVVQPDAVSSLADYLDRHPQAGVAGPRVINPDGTVQQSARAFPGVLTGLFGRTSLATRIWPDNPQTQRELIARETQTEPVVVDWVAGCCLMARRDAFDAVGGFDEGFFLYWEDADFCKRLATAGWLTAYVPSAVVVHAVGRSSRLAPARAIRAFHASAYRYVARHGAARFRPLALALAAAVLCTRAMLKLVALRITGLRQPAGGSRRGGPTP